MITHKISQGKYYKCRTYALYTSPKDPFPISSRELNLDPAASARPAVSSISMPKCLHCTIPAFNLQPHIHKTQYQNSIIKNCLQTQYLKQHWQTQSVVSPSMPSE